MQIMRWMISTFGAASVAASLALGQTAPAAAGPATATPAPTAPAPVRTGPPPSFDQVIDLVVDRENRFVEQMQKMHPLVETYIQHEARSGTHERPGKRRILP